MKVGFSDKELESLILEGRSKKYKRILRNKSLFSGLVYAYNIMCIEKCTADLKKYSYLHYEKLKYNYSGYSSVRIKNNSIERLIFTEDQAGITIDLIQLEDQHYGNKK